MIDLQISLGQVNFTNFLHVTVAKIATPTVIEFEQWFATPFAQKNFTVPNLDPTIYFVTYYDAPTNSSLGTIQLQLQVNGLTSQVLSERRYYTCGVDMADNSTTIVDSYLIGQKVVGVFKEGARYLKPTSEWTFDTLTGTISILTGVSFSTGEVCTVDIFYNSNSVVTPNASNSFYTSELTISALTATLTATDVNKRVRLTNNNTGIVKQQITMPFLSTITDGDGFLFDRVDGFSFSQTELIFSGADTLFYKGFGGSFARFPLFWIGMGEKLLIRKSGSDWELILNYEGVDVGQRTVIASSTGQAINYVKEDGALYSETQLPRLMYWLVRVLGAANYLVDDNITNIGWTPGDSSKFYVNSARTFLRMPNTNVYFRKI